MAAAAFIGGAAIAKYLFGDTAKKSSNKNGNFQSFGSKMLHQMEQKGLEPKLKADVDNGPFYELTFLRLNDEGDEAALIQNNDKQFLIRSLMSLTKGQSKNVFAQIHKWASIEEYEKELAQKSTPSYEILERFRMRPADMETFDLEKLIQQGYGLELGIRRAKKKTNFSTLRESFISRVTGYSGFLWDREYVSIDEDLFIIVFGWQSWAAFEKAQTTTLTNPKTLWRLIVYFSGVSLRAFQAGVPIVIQKQ